MYFTLSLGGIVMFFGEDFQMIFVKIMSKAEYEFMLIEVNFYILI